MVLTSKKELFTVAAINGNNTAVNTCRVYTPSLQTRAFELLFSEQIQFFGATICNHIKILLTGGAVTEYTPYINSIGSSNPYPIYHTVYVTFIWEYKVIKDMYNHLYPIRYVKITKK